MIRSGIKNSRIAPMWSPLRISAWLAAGLREGLLLFFIFCLLAPITGAACAQEPKSDNHSNTLWRIDSSSNAIYLMGSIHMLKENNFPLSQAVELAFIDSDILVLEMDLDEAGAPENIGLLLKNGLLANGTTLEQSLSHETFGLAKKKTAEIGINIDLFRMYKPWLFATELTTLKLQALGFRPERGLDIYFYLKAKQSGKDIIGLETFAFQLGLLDALSDSNQDLLVKQTLVELDVLEQEMNTVVAAWEKGDIESLEMILLESFKQIQGLKEIILDRRNRSWLKEILSYMNRPKNYLVVVGAGHMIGKDGLISLLKKEGVSVTQL